MFFGIISYFNARRIFSFPRKKVLSLQERRLHATLLHAHTHSKFYRELWAKAGITRATLLRTPLSKFPTVNKHDLMTHFEDVITVPGIEKGAIEDFIRQDPTGKELFQNKYIAINTSGSSGFVGIFLFSLKFWARLSGTVASRLLPLPISDFLLGRVRIAFIGEASGHHAGFSLVNDVPFLKTLSVDVALPQEELVKKLTAFKPTVLVGYASGLVVVAEAQIQKLLDLAPKMIITSGEPLTADREERIKLAFGRRPVDYYGATECLAMAASLHSSGTLDVFDDILKLEAIDDHGAVVPSGVLGRVVITIFGNDIFPLIRYTLDDELTIEGEDDAFSFTRISQVTGRKLDRITLTLKDKRVVEIHPMDLVGLFFPGLKQYQIEQTGVRTVVLRMVVEGDRERITEEIQTLIGLLLAEKCLRKTDVDVQLSFVESIAPNPKTGKTPMIIPLKKASIKK